MSLFYGYKSKEEELEEKIMKNLETRLEKFTFHRHNVVFDFNVTRASKYATFWKSKPEYINNIVDKEGKSKQISVLYWYEAANGPILDTSGKHHFLSPKNGEDVVMYANCSLLRFSDISIFVVLKRNSVKPKNNGYELIISNGRRGIGYRAGSDNTVNILITGGVSTSVNYKHSDLSKKHVMSAHWRSEYGQSYFIVNNVLVSTFSNPITINNDSNVIVFGRPKGSNHFSDISIFEIKVMEGYLTLPEIREEIKNIMVDNNISIE